MKPIQCPVCKEWAMHFREDLRSSRDVYNCSECRRQFSLLHAHPESTGDVVVIVDDVNFEMIMTAVLLGCRVRPRRRK